MGASRPALPLFPSSLADFIWGQRVVFITTAIWLRFKGSRALRGKGWAGGGGMGDTFAGERISRTDELSGQGRVLY